MRWALTAGKTIVILTEFVVILAFLVRFKFDRDLNDLNEAISQKRAVVESFTEIEKQARDTHSRLEIVKKGTTIGVATEDLMQKLKMLTPKGVVYDTLEISAEEISAQGRAENETELAKLVAELKKDTAYTSISIGKTEFIPRYNGINFEISASKKVVAKPTPAPAKAKEEAE